MKLFVDVLWFEVRFTRPGESYGFVDLRPCLVRFFFNEDSVLCAWSVFAGTLIWDLNLVWCDIWIKESRRWQKHREGEESEYACEGDPKTHEKRLIFRP